MEFGKDVQANYLSDKISRWRSCAEVTFRVKSKARSVKYKNENLLNYQRTDHFTYQALVL